MRNKKSKYKISNTKNNKGITLVALIITIIVLLILAVVAIRAVTGDGIIQYAKKSQSEYDKGKEKEKIMLAFNEWKLAEHTVQGATFEGVMKDKIEGATVTANEDGSVTVVFEEKNTVYEVTKDGKISDHNMGEWEITVVATETTPGTAIRKCSDCEYTETIELCVINLETGEAFKNVSKAVADTDTVSTHTLKLLHNVTETGEVSVYKDVTVDINGMVFCVNGNLDATAADMVDGSDGNIGNLQVSGTAKLATDNTDLPIRREEEPDSYMLHDYLSMQQKQPTYTTNEDGTITLSFKYRPSIGTTREYNASIFGDGAEDNGITIACRVFFINRDNVVTETTDIVNPDSDVADVYSDTLAFTMNFSNVQDYVSDDYSLKITSILISDTGVEKIGPLVDVVIPAS